MQIVIDIPYQPSEQRIINVPIHFCGGQVVDAGGYGFEERKSVGKWYCDMYGVFRCNSCGKSAHLDSRGRAWLDRYCSWCGAKMEVDE